MSENDKVSSDQLCLDAPIPEHQHFDLVRLCLDWLETKNPKNAGMGLLQLESRSGIAKGSLLFVAIAMRDTHLLQCLGHDIRSAWIAVPWPEAVKSVRREVVWTLSEWARDEENRAKGVVDLFDFYDPVSAARRARAATHDARDLRSEGDEVAAEAAMLRANLLREVTAERLARDQVEKAQARARLGSTAS